MDLMISKVGSMVAGLTEMVVDLPEKGGFELLVRKQNTFIF